MLTLARDSSLLLVVDLQTRLMPAIEEGAAVVRNARRLLDAAALFGIPPLITEQYAAGLGATVPELLSPDAAAGPAVAAKMTFDACRTPGFVERLGDRADIVVAGCETHVCVLQTALGLIEAGRRVYLVRDATGSRRAESKEAAVARLRRHGAEIVTTEMVLFEWLGSAEDPCRRAVIGLIK